MNANTLVLETTTPGQTEAIGLALAALLPSGAFVALRGELASGKTCLARGMAKFYVGDEIVSSPTFTIVNQYGSGPTLYHIDLYRLGSIEEIGGLGYEELFEPDDGVCAVEWAERAEAVLPDIRLDVLLEHGGHDARKLTFSDRGVLPTGWQESLMGSIAGVEAGN